VNIEGQDLWFDARAEGDDALKRWMGMLMFSLLPVEYIDEALTPLKRAFETTFRLALPALDEDVFEIYSEPVDTETLELLNHF
jgi:hypothetical protein